MVIHFHDSRSTSSFKAFGKRLDICGHKSLISRPFDPTNRLWLAIDELPSLNKLSDLQLCLAEGRKYGCGYGTWHPEYSATNGNIWDEYH